MKRYLSILALLSLMPANLLASANYGGVKCEITFTTILVAIISAGATMWWNKRKQFSDSITSERINYLQQLRENAVGFCELLTKGDTDKPSLEHYYYTLLFLHDPTKPSDHWDKNVVRLIKYLYDNRKNANKKDFQDKLNEFVVCMQAALALEWHGMCDECIKGVLSKQEKEELRQEFFRNYKNYYKNKIHTL